MKHLKGLAVAVLAVVPSLTFAAEQRKSVTFDQPAVVGNQQLKPGEYTFKWDDSQPNTTVNIESKGKTVASVPAQVVHERNPNNASFEFNTASGQNQLQRVYTSKQQLVFGPAAQTSSMSNPPSE